MRNAQLGLLSLLALVSACVTSPAVLSPNPNASVVAGVSTTEALLPPLPTVPVTPTSAIAEVLLEAETSLQRLPNPRYAITLQGYMFTDKPYAESQEAKKDWYSMLALALAAKHTDQSRFKIALGSYLDAWLAVFKPTFDPINEADFHYFVLAVDLGRTYLSSEQLAKTEVLFRTMASGFLDPRRYPPGTGTNNWQSHRIKLATVLSFSLEDEALLQKCRQAFRRQIANNLRPDGSNTDFYQRDALHYVVYSLEPLLLASLLGKKHGQDWFTYKSHTGSSLNTSLQWLAEYAAGRKTHEEFKKTSVELDRRRAAAGLSRFSGVWDPTRAARCYHLAAHLDAGWIQLANRLGPETAWVELIFPITETAAPTATP